MQHQQSENVRALREIIPFLEGSPCGPKATWALPEGKTEAWAIWRDGNAVSITKARISAGATFPIHTHGEVEIMVVYRGSLRYKSALIERVVLEGQCVKVEPGKPHQVTATGDADCYLILVHVPAGEGLPHAPANE